MHQTVGLPDVHGLWLPYVGGTSSSFVSGPSFGNTCTTHIQTCQCQGSILEATPKLAQEGPVRWLTEVWYCGYTQSPPVSFSQPAGRGQPLLAHLCEDGYIHAG